MRRHKVWVLGLAFGALVLLALSWLLLNSGSVASTRSVAWALQPDQFPLGTILQGSRVEINLGAFSRQKPAPLPPFLSHLPSGLRKSAEWMVNTYRQWLAKSAWRLRVQAPGFTEVQEAAIQFHSSQGPFAFVALRIKTQNAGQWKGELKVHLANDLYGSTNLAIPVSVIVLPKPASISRRLLITESPYECYATENGRNFEPLAQLLTTLAQRDQTVDLTGKLPSSLSGYAAVLLAGRTLAALDPAQMTRLQKFVSSGGRLILAADAFFVPTAPKANALLGPFGLRIVNQDAGRAVTNCSVNSDSLTVGVSRLQFWRPARIVVTDPKQGKVLVSEKDSSAGYIAVSRKTGQGEVIVLNQSLWWNWIRTDPAQADNKRLMENLLAP